MKINITKKLIVVLITQLLLYLGLFIFTPNLLMKKVSNGNWIFVIVLYVIVVCSIAVLIFVPKIRYWIPGIPFLWCMIMLYHPRDLYGISDGVALKGSSVIVDAFFFTLSIFLLQLSVKLIGVLNSKIIKIIRYTTKSM